MEICSLKSMKPARFRRLTETHSSLRLDHPGLPVRNVTLRTNRRLVPTTFSLEKDDHHRAVVSLRSGDFYFSRSEFWTDKREKMPASAEPVSNRESRYLSPANRSVDQLWVVTGYVFGKREDAVLALKLNSIGGVGRKFDFTGLGPKPRDHVANRSTSLQLSNK